MLLGQTGEVAETLVGDQWGLVGGTGDYWDELVEVEVLKRDPGRDWERSLGGHWLLLGVIGRHCGGAAWGCPGTTGTLLGCYWFLLVYTG